METSKRLLKIVVSNHYNVQLREKAVKVAEKINRIPSKLATAEKKAEILRVCQEGLNSVKSLNALIDVTKKENYQFPTRADVAVESNIIRALGYYSSTFCFALVGIIHV